MPDKPMFDRPPHQQRAGAAVLHEALAMRQEVERELAEAGVVRSNALHEATQILDQARLAASHLQEESEGDAQQIVEQAREQALGIIAQARDEAGQLVAEAHAEAAQFEAWARQEAQDEIRREMAAIRQTIAERRGDVSGSLDALQVALDRAVTSLDGASWLSASLSEQPVPSRGYELGDLADMGDLADLEDLADLAGTSPVDADRPATPRMTLVRPVPDHDVTADDLDDLEDDGDDGDDDDLDDLDGIEVVDVIQVVGGTEVEDAEVLDELDEAVVVPDDETQVLRHQEDARPLGWLFRSPPTA